MTWFEANGTRLRAPEPDDADALSGYLNHEEVFEDRHFGDRVPWPLSRDEIVNTLSEKSDTSRLLLIEAEGHVVGHVSIDWWWDALQPWGAVVIDPAHRRMGHGRRAATMILDYFFEQTPAHVVTTDSGEWNTAGREFTETMGFSEAGRYRNQVRRGGEWQDIVTFDLLRREWEASRGT